MCARAPRERRTSENSVKAKFVERHHSEGKRCMLASLKSGADFSKGCAGKRISLSLFATHPHRLSIRELISTHLELALIGTWRAHVPISSRSCLERHRSSRTAGKR